ncbi:MAG TPA: hypothetical protein DIT99_22270, partial [Candidatus Latescibacteria bacterium]|nr:hypothetical protein [Candidatus Latescibacterota bacterium]
VNGEINQSLRVLMAPADNATKIIALLTAFQDFTTVDYFDARSGLPTLDLLKTYDLVMTWPNYQYADPTGMGNILADYVDQGGNVLLGVFSHGSDSWALKGRIKGATYTPFGGGGSTHFRDANLGVHDASHQMMDGVTSLKEFFRDTPLT